MLHENDITSLASDWLSGYTNLQYMYVVDINDMIFDGAVCLMTPHLHSHSDVSDNYITTIAASFLDSMPVLEIL